LTLTYFSWGLIGVLGILLNWFFSYEETTEFESTPTEKERVEALAVLGRG